MTLYDQTKMTDLKHTTTVQRNIPAKTGIGYDSSWLAETL